MLPSPRRLDFPRAAFIDGKYRAGRGAKLKTHQSGHRQGDLEIAACNEDDVDLAVSKARQAFDQGHWAKLHPSERKDVLIRLCKLITRNRRELAVMESLDSGKPIRDCETDRYSRDHPHHQMACRGRRQAVRPDSTGRR